MIVNAHLLELGHWKLEPFKSASRNWRYCVRLLVISKGKSLNDDNTIYEYDSPCSEVEVVCIRFHKLPSTPFNAEKSPVSCATVLPNTYLIAKQPYGLCFDH
jgi:hypothetical protein